MTPTFSQLLSEGRVRSDLNSSNQLQSNLEESPPCQFIFFKGHFETFLTLYHPDNAEAILQHICLVRINKYVTFQEQFSEYIHLHPPMLFIIIN